MKLIERIKDSDFYKNKFEEWEATEQIIDDKKSFWCLKAKGSEYQKVCLYVDDHFMAVYGDYGTMTFNQMTWKGSVYNLQYDNIGYQMAKLSSDSKKSLEVFDYYKCRKDIFDWLIERLKYKYGIEDDLIESIISLLNDNTYLNDFEIEDFCDESECDELTGIIEFTNECLNNTDEYEWIYFLRGSNLGDFDEECESVLWNAGNEIDQRYFINMYALQVCAEKLNSIRGIDNDQ